MTWILPRRIATKVRQIFQSVTTQLACALKHALYYTDLELKQTKKLSGKAERKGKREEGRQTHTAHRVHAT